MTSTQPDFIVIDTEGSPELREVAIVDSKGKVIYHAFPKEHPENRNQRVNLKPLSEILQDFQRLAQGKITVFHYAEHDLQVLRRSCYKARVKWQDVRVACSWELAKQKFPKLESHGLEYLSKQLNLKVENKIFNPELAHAASYDAAYTYQLYIKLKEQEIQKGLQNAPNPFGHSRVDTPFQEHVDLIAIYHSEFELLKSILQDIKHDRNHQSKGAVVIGEPGCGKTHLIMRMAKELLKTNRLLFIRQPNNADAILFHIYSRILESLVETVAGTEYTQLEYLFARSSTQIIQSREIKSNKDQEILAFLEENPLHLYRYLGAEGTSKKQDNWETLERRIREWWDKTYAQVGYSAQILKGIIKFCRYTHPWRRELVTRWLAGNELTPEEAEQVGLPRWNEEISRETFALEAITVLSKLSILDQPLIIVFDQLEGLGLAHNHQILHSFGEAVKEIFTHVCNSLIVLNLFPDRWEQFQTFFDGSIVDRISQHIVKLNQPENQKLKDILALKLQANNLELDTLFDSEDLEDILNQNSIRAVLNRAADYYRYKVHGISLPLRITPQNQRSIEFTSYQRLLRVENELAALKETVSTLLRVIPGEVLESKTEQSNIDENLDIEVFKGRSDLPKNEIDIIEQYLQEKQAVLKIEYEKPQIITDSDDIGKLSTIAEAFQTIHPLEIGVLRLGKRRIPEHIVLKVRNQERVIGCLQCDSNSFTTKIKNFNELVVNHKNKRFELLRDMRQPAIKGEVGKREIEKLQNSSNGNFVLLERQARIELELFYYLIVDVQNRDLEVSLDKTFQILCERFPQQWIVKLFLSHSIT